ncbi:heat shock 70kDa protein 1/2/6/8 [Paragonimus westermani]|uniref:Heat shock 70kDa protein 1/2/6/8 n=1 Tax=Paragonimus westermani TaxID=34504 RepID=A0A5J4NGJ9_9TREM|nr:heat shock 70kDa protein 1/2/6/8 [Paragonimus westermani]
MAIHENGSTRVILNEIDKRVTPSVVAFTDEAIVFGDEAKEQASLSPENTIYDAKRLIGRRFNDPTLIKDRRIWPFQLVDVQGKPRVRVRYASKVKLLCAEEILSLLIAHLKTSAESYINKEIKQAVITVPANFDLTQREATRDAAKLAGLDIVYLLNEPTAAVLAYALELSITEDRNLLVFDLGGGTVDVSVMQVKKTSFVIRSTAGDTHLGGQDFDERLLLYFLGEILKNHGVDLSGNKSALQRLKIECEIVKRRLSSAEVAEMRLDELSPGLSFQTTIKRAQFEDMNKDLFEKALIPVKTALEYAQLTVTDIHHIILVGGSTRIPAMQQMLQEFFNLKPLNKQVNPDEVVACGAAIYAAMMTANGPEGAIEFTDVTSLSLGLKKHDGSMEVLIKRNSSLPITVTRSDFTTVYPGDTQADFELYEGEDKLAVNNRLLDQFTITNLTKNRFNLVQFEVTFSIDRNGILSVIAAEKDKENRYKLTVGRTSGTLSTAERNEIRARMKSFYADEKARYAQDEQREALLSYAIAIKTKVQQEYGDGECNLNSEQKQLIVDQCDEIIRWVKGGLDHAIAGYCQKKNELENLIIGSGL